MMTWTVAELEACCVVVRSEVSCVVAWEAGVCTVCCSGGVGIRCICKYNITKGYIALHSMHTFQQGIIFSVITLCLVLQFFIIN